MSFTLLYVAVLLVTFSPFVWSIPSNYPSSSETWPRSANVCDFTESWFDYSVKLQRSTTDPTCPGISLLKRQNDDYSCSESKPCSNGACCSKKTGYCNYGPKACGTTGTSPNDVCWSNCDAKAECGRYAEVPGKKCPLNVCCSQFGFCGMSAEFCKKTGDEETSCQSNCDQPGSGGKGGDVQSRVIGYYEAWAHDRSCNGMDFKDIPVDALTHLYFSFGYISPSDLNVVPMDDLPVGLFSKMTDLKKRNGDLKMIIALGGWTFNDNGTATQPVFSNMVSTSANRQKFIANLLAFLREFAFDGVDFDWEYPGAGDRGGNEKDGENFTLFLKELHAAISKEPIKYVVSFTIPTSYWYLRGFDLKAVDHVDFVNVMSYDLHGIWDSNNPIGSHVLAHTNLSEIQSALDLLWRNDVPAGKVNLGLGFYGRSFQLADPGCWKPGCIFLGGASPGTCTKNSGTLSYREITNIIDQNKLKPFHDKQEAVKYITWNRDQWVSYDDEETIKQKVEFANKLGLGGLLVWSIDQDTDDLKALKAVLAPKQLNVFASKSGDASYWQDATAADCYVTACGGKCKAGFSKVTKQPCGDATVVFRHSDDDDSLLCCPLSSSPDPGSCTWRGSAPSCNGQCHDGEVALQLNRWGDGKYCEDGNKVYCCEVPEEKQSSCYWTGYGSDCHSGDTLLTFAGTFLGAIADISGTFVGFGSVLADLLNDFDMEERKLFCCPESEAKRWQNCEWKGKPGSCFDNHCNLNSQVQLATSAFGLGEPCFPRSERSRVFCCEPSDGAPLFLPVPLEWLFPKPPPNDDADVEFDLQLDNTWGTGEAKTSEDDDPDDASFSFVVLTSPDEIQVSLDKRDGSHWELYSCQDTADEGEQTIQMFCTDASESSNCGKIHLGHGVPGTILEMPEGCGPGKYAVAKSMKESAKQTLPAHLAKRNYGHKPVIYDLTFDYDFRRVPRDLGTTQMRIDFSNEEGYWDTVVDEAAKTKRKRSLKAAGGNHKRWLEDEWRDDLHFGGLSREELHKRWFGSNVLDWLKKLVSPKIKTGVAHTVDESFTATLIDKTWSCTIGGVDVDAKLLVAATAHVQVDTSFGLTIITTLGVPPDLSKSYLYFKNKGNVEAIFTLDALGEAKFETQDWELGGLDNFPGATLRVPGIATIGPNFILYASADASLVLSGHLESKVTLATWDVRQTYPDQGTDYQPTAVDAPNPGADKIGQPTFDYSLTAEGDITAHLKPTFEFGIKFDDWLKVDSCYVDLVADGYLRFHAKAELSSDASVCPFEYGVDVGANLYAYVTAPFPGWERSKFNIGPRWEKQLIKGGTCPTHTKRDIGGAWPLDSYQMHANETYGLGKRAAEVAPSKELPANCFICPSSDEPATECSTITGWDDGELDGDLSSKRKRDLDDELHFFEERAAKNIKFCSGPRLAAISPRFDSSGDYVKSYPGVTTYGPLSFDCDNMDFDVVTTPTKSSTPSTKRYATEHVLEFQLLPKFLDHVQSIAPMFDDPEDAGSASKVTFCQYLNLWYTSETFEILGYDGKYQGLQWLAQMYPGKLNDWADEFVLLEKYVNGVKERMWGDGRIRTDAKMEDFIAQRNGKKVEEAIAVVKQVIWAVQYHIAVNQILETQVGRISKMFDELENGILQREVDMDRPYEKIGLAAEWKKWMNGRASLAKSKAEQFVNNWLPKIEAAHSGTTTPQATKDRIQALKIAAQNSPLWTPPTF